MNELFQWFENRFNSMGSSWDFLHESNRFFAILVSLFLSLIVTQIAKRWLVPVLYRLVCQTHSKWDHLLLNTHVLRASCNVLPPFILLYTIPLFSDDGKLPHWIKAVCLIYLTLTLLLLALSLVDALYDIWDTFENLRDKPIRGYLQVIKILFYLVATILIISTLLNTSPLAWLTGLGASAAVLSLVFKDTFLGLIASVQLSANDMVRKGDWITIPKHNINGIVEEISLNTVKIKNFDATMLTIPPHLLINESFQNWRTMKEGGARRVQKSVYIDTQTVRFYPPEQAKELPGYTHLQENSVPDAEESGWVNLSLLRIYLKQYLDQHPFVSNELLCIVRELQHTPEGIPIELLFFITDTEWPRYETIQANILDHITAIVPQFGLRIFQHPSGQNINQIAASLLTKEQ